MLAEKIFGYARVSSKEQNLDRQIDELKKYVPNSVDIITEKQRNKLEVKQELENLRAAGVNIRILDIPTTMMDFGQYGDMQRGIMEMVNNILIEVLSTIAESERRTIRKRQAEGIAAARARGKHLGRPQVEFPNNWIAVYQRWQDKEITAVQAMEELDVKKTSFYNLVRRYKKSRGESYHSNNPIIPRSDTH